MAATIVKSIRCSPELWAILEAYAKMEGKTANWVLVRFLEEMLSDPVTGDTLSDRPHVIEYPLAQTTHTQSKLSDRAYKVKLSAPYGVDAITGEPLPKPMPSQKKGKK